MDWLILVVFSTLPISFRNTYHGNWDILMQFYVGKKYALRLYIIERHIQQ